MENLSTETSIVFDISEPARRIEQEFSHLFLQKYEYTTHRSTKKKNVPYACSYQIQLNDCTVLRETVMMSPNQKEEEITPPIIGLKLVELYLGNVMKKWLAYDKRSEKSMLEIVSPFLNRDVKEHFESLVDRDEQDRLESLLEQVFRPCIAMVNDMDQFIGKNPWIIHFITRKHRALYVEKSIDYRIHEWTKLKESGVI